MLAYQVREHNKTSQNIKKEEQRRKGTEENKINLVAINNSCWPAFVVLRVSFLSCRPVSLSLFFISFFLFFLDCFQLVLSNLFSFSLSMQIVWCAGTSFFTRLLIAVVVCHCMAKTPSRSICNARKLRPDSSSLHT